MPLPKPKTGESQDDWIDRCMGIDSMKEEFPDSDQRLAVCFKQWKDKNQKDMEMDDKEYRTYPLELREGEDGHFRGHAAVFDSWSQDLGGFTEVVRRGAFKKTLKESDVRATFNHDPNYVLGRNTAGTLGLKEDDTGLAVDIDPPDTQWARDLKISMGRGDINQMSFAFRTIKDNWPDGDERKRELLEVSLHNGDVSIVTYPAYEKTRISAKRALDKHLAEEPAADHSSEDEKEQAVRKWALERKRRSKKLDEAVFAKS